MFKEILKNLMNERNINQRQLSNTANIPTTTISGWLNANRLPDYNALIKLADFFGCTTDYLLGREDDYGIITAGQTTVLTKDEEELLSVYRKMDANTKQQTLGFFRAAFSSNF